MPVWWKDLKSIKQFTTLTPTEKLSEEDCEKLGRVKYEKEYEKAASDADDSSPSSHESSFHDFLSNLSPDVHLSSTSSTSPTVAPEVLAKIVGTKMAKAYPNGPLSLLSVHQATTQRSGYKPDPNVVGEEHYRLLPTSLKMMADHQTEDLKLHKSSLSVGKTTQGGSVSSGLHYESRDLVILVMRGYKRVRMIEPKDRAKCYMREDEGEGGEGDFVQEEEQEGEEEVRI